MGATENFSSSVKVETSESIRGYLSEAKNPVSLYKKAIEVLSRMEKNFDIALGSNSYDYFDGNVDVHLEKTEFERKAKELNIKAKELYSQMNISSALYVLAQSKLGISSIEETELNSLVQLLLQTQENSKKQVENDLKDGKLNNPEHIKVITKPENLEFITNIGILKFSEIDQYNPKTTPHKIQVQQNTQSFLEEKYGDRRNMEATNMNNLSFWLINFCEKNPKLLSELSIKDIHNMSPKQAILLTSQIVQERLEYSDLQIVVKKKDIPESRLHRYSLGYLGVPTSTEYILDKGIISNLSKEQQTEILTNPKVAYAKYAV